MSNRTKRWRTQRGGGFARKQHTVNWAAIAMLVAGLSAAFFWAWRGGSVSPAPSAALANSNLPLCPVGGEPINFAVSVPSDDGPVFFCCKHCIEKFRADPAKYAEAVGAERRALAKLPRVQVRCPVSGAGVSPAVFIERDGEKTHFCGKECREKFQSDPDRHRTGLAASYSYQTKCPVSGKPIDPRVSATLTDGTTVYLCSAACATRLLHNPKEYASKLAEQGLWVSP